MVQPKLVNDSKSKPATDGTSNPVPSDMSKEERKRLYANWIHGCKNFHLIAMCCMFWRLLEVSTYGPLFWASEKLVEITDPDWEPSVACVILLAVVTLQLDAIMHVFIFCKLSAQISKVKFGRTDMLFKYVRFCIPQAVLGVLLLLQPHGFDLVLQSQITLFLNTCFSLLVIINSYINLLKKKQRLAKQSLPPREGSVEIPAIVVTFVA